MTIRPLPTEFQRKAADELNEDPDRIREDLDSIKEWAAKQPHLKIRTDDQWLLSMLRGCKFSLERTKQKLDLLYTIRAITPEFFANRDPFLPEIQDILKLGLCLPLPKTADPTAPRIVLLRVNNLDPARIRAEDGMKTMLMILDILLNEDDNFVVSGGHLFIDDKHVTVNHILLLTPTLIKKINACLVEAYALRPKGFHVINIPPFAEAAYNMLKSCLSNKVLKRVRFYDENDTDELYKVVPLCVLPEEYGGSGGSVQNLTELWKKKVESYRSWFLEDAQYVSDETKRPNKPRTPQELYGLEGSFRKLELD